MLPRGVTGPETVGLEELPAEAAGLLLEELTPGGGGKIRPGGGAGVAEAASEAGIAGFIPD
jgi:hypothetical protein